MTPPKTAEPGDLIPAWAFPICHLDCDTLCQNLLALNPLHLLLGQPLPSIPTHKMGSIKHTSLMRRVRAKMGHAWKASPHAQAPAAVAAITGMTELNGGEGLPEAGGISPGPCGG